MIYNQEIKERINQVIRYRLEAIYGEETLETEENFEQMSRVVNIILTDASAAEVLKWLDVYSFVFRYKITPAGSQDYLYELFTGERVDRVEKETMNSWKQFGDATYLGNDNVIIYRSLTKEVQDVPPGYDSGRDETEDNAEPTPPDLSFAGILENIDSKTLTYIGIGIAALFLSRMLR